jgi:hypothetical protein
MESQSPMVKSAPESQEFELRELKPLSLGAANTKAIRTFVSRHSNQDPRVIHKFFDEWKEFGCFSLEAAFERLVVAIYIEKKSRLIDRLLQNESDVIEKFFLIDVD